MARIGEHHWTSGPLVVGPDDLRERLRMSFSAADARRLRSRSLARIAKLRGKNVLVLSGGPTSVLVRGDDEVIFVTLRTLAVSTSEALRVRAAEIPERLFEPTRLHLRITTPMTVFDVYAPHSGPLRERCARKIALRLPPGDYAIDECAEYMRVRPFAELSVVRLRPRARVVTRSEKRAERQRLFVLLSAHLLGSYWGRHDFAGKRIEEGDAARAEAVDRCAPVPVFPVAGALAIAMPGPPKISRSEDVITAAAPAEDAGSPFAWKKTRAAIELRGGLVALPFEADGRNARRAPRVRLPDGSWALDLARDGRGMLRAVRLRRRA